MNDHGLSSLAQTSVGVCTGGKEEMPTSCSPSLTIDETLYPPTKMESRN